MISKLSGYEDLFAYDAKYHKLCYCGYIADRNIRAYQNKGKVSDGVSNLNYTSASSETSGSEQNDSAKSIETDTGNIENEMLIIHKAAGILKKYMHDFKFSQTYFPSPDDINQTEFKKQVPNMLLKFVSWLINDDFYNTLDVEIDTKAVVPCNIIMGLYNKKYKRNYFQIGLGLYIHHLVRSKQILDALSEIGLSCSYNDIRQLTTSLANQKITNNATYVPPGVEVVDDF